MTEAGRVPCAEDGAVMFVVAVAIVVALATFVTRPEIVPGMDFGDVVATTVAAVFVVMLAAVVALSTALSIPPPPP